MRITTRQDALFALGALGGGLLMLSGRGYASWDTGWPPAVWWRLLPLLVLCAAMLFRRTAPLLGLAIATPAEAAEVVLGPSLAGFMIYADALYAASLYGPRRTAGWLLSASTGVSVALGVGVGVATRTWSLGVVAAGIAGCSWPAPVLTAMVVRGHRDKAELERQRARQVARMAELDRRNAVAAERARMARELHDVVANHLSAVALHSSAVLRLPGMDPAAVRQAMAVIRENSVQGLAEMRRMIGLLREGGEVGDPASTPRLADVDGLAERAARPDLTVSCKVRGTAEGLAAAVELAAYRIVQESLTNVLKHAGPGHAEVVVELGADRVTIVVDSPLGEGAAGVPGSGSGLIGMRERASLLGGTFAAGPQGDRWLVRAELPTAEEA